VDIRQFIYQLVDIFPGPLKTAARWVADRIFAAWDDISAVLRVARQLWLQLWTTWHNLVWGVASAVLQIAITLQHLYREFVPRLAQMAIDAVIRWVVDRLNNLLTFVRNVNDTLLRLITDQVNHVLSLFNAWRQFLLDLINDTRNTLRLVRDRVVALLTEPGALVEWILATLIGALVRWVDQHFEALAEFFWARRQRLILTAASRLESLIAKLL
jgi:hypothetical protein